MKARQALAIVLLALGYAAFDFAFSGSSGARTGSGTRSVQRLLGPAAELLADVQWIRFTRALIRGEHDRALFHADSALALDPQATEGWDQLATHLATFHGSPERETDPRRREAWFLAGIEVTHRGAAFASDPGRLALCRGLLYVNRLQIDPDTFPESRNALCDAALEAFEEARDLGVGGLEDMDELERYLAEQRRP